MLSKTGIYNVFILVLAICIHGQAIAQNGTWETKAPMLTATLSPAAEVINGVLYVAGGNNGGRLPYCKHTIRPLTPGAPGRPCRADGMPETVRG